MSFMDRKKGRYPMPTIDELDLQVTAQEVPLKKEFDFVSRIVFSIQFPTNTILFSTFGIDAALTKGLNIKYRGEMLFPHGIKTNGEFKEFTYDVSYVSDSTGTKINYLSARLSFFRFTKGNLGLKIDSWRKFFVVVQDDLSGSLNTHIVANVQGWRF